jgi:antitoxin YefM
MDVISYSQTRARLKDVLDKVVADRTPVIVSRQKAEAVVMVSLTDWNAIEETLHLLSTGANARRLHDSVQELDADRGTARDLIEP